jgi:ribosomal-protein-alanine N-acetyltransferase
MAVPLLGGVAIRPVCAADAQALADAYALNRGYLQPWEPIRAESHFTAEGQRTALAGALAEQDAGRRAFWLLMDGQRVVGRISLTDIVRGAFQNGHLGYWVADGFQGRGLATAAAQFVCTHADRELGLHRIQAGTLAHNFGSQTVLRRCGFTAIGTAEQYLKINGTWQDHVLFQRILPR